MHLTGQIEQHPERLLADVLQDVADTSGDAPALIFQGNEWSYATLVQQTNRISRWAIDQGIQKGDVVGLLMKNRPDYLAIWLGISRIGGVVALINDQLRGEALAHCLRVVGARRLIATFDFEVAVADAMRLVDEAVQVWHFDTTESARGLKNDIARYSGDQLSIDERRQVALSDRALYIYTSGTTGLPKAANVSHRRILTWSFWFAGMADVQPADRMYNCLPMNHSVGGVVAIGSMLVSGASVVLREKFSTREFWDDVVRWKCTTFQYIGELCRYLVNAPPSTIESAHMLRLCCGNGLRGDVWTAFQSRFKVPQILEFYAASEGSFSLFNLEGKPGAIGRVPGFLSHRFPAEIVRIDIESGAPVRDTQGFCTRCAINEAGEAIGKLNEDPNGTTGRFEGYSSVAESENKILRNVFKPGDAWLRTGDLMRKDEKNFFYFVDRMGDTFRWKGENVSTAQVSEALCDCRGVIEAAVYGVAIPGSDGRAGMAALVVDPSFDLVTFREDVATRLPAFARPIFLRLKNGLALTATFKQQKHELQRDGYDPAKVIGPLYIDSNVTGRYSALSQDDFDGMQRGVRLL
ncbi:MAG: AMP-dependent synthetase and ligase [Tardiphaga sp.]|nr:AMP-dependent synthetase and ligase [Tardiphaga sp.]